MLRTKLGALTKLYDVPASQLWIGAVAIGLRYADEDASSNTFYSAILALVAISLVFFYLMSVNDYFDVEVDREKGERSPLVGNEISMNGARIAIIAAAALGLGLAFLVSSRFLIFSLIIFALATLYSVPPLRYKRFYPFSTLGEVAGAFVLFLIGYSVIGLPTVTALFISTITTFVATGARLRQEARHLDFDSRTGKNTFAVVHGANAVKIVSQVLTIIALVEVASLRVYGLLSDSTALFAGLFVITPLLIKQVHDKRYLRMSTLVWGFGLYLLVVLIPAF